MTALQKFIEIIDHLEGKNGIQADAVLMTLKDKSIELIEKEKEQIISAYCQGCKDTYGNDEPDPKKPDSYYGQLYYDINYDKTKFRQQKRDSADN